MVGTDCRIYLKLGGLYILCRICNIKKFKQKEREKNTKSIVA